MTRIAVLGGTGYAGSNIAAAGARRGHRVTVWSRNAPEHPVAGVEYRTGDVADPAVVAAALEDTDVVLTALSPRGTLAGEGVMRAVEKGIAEQAMARGIRFGMVGGAGSMRVSEGGPKVYDAPDFNPEWRRDSVEIEAVMADLAATPESFDWFVISPAGEFGAWNPGERTGSYRTSSEVLLTDESGRSVISGADFGEAFLDEVERPAHHRERFGVAY